jgi:hypothetical protein
VVDPEGPWHDWEATPGPDRPPGPEVPKRREEVVGSEADGTDDDGEGADD